ncbi:EamA family transporter [Thalassobius sp. I31.1]|uniref:EamA family transporter n=1 Tax=Thalassobius sp. I31.1 TaxID=2109912 RepID=UPI000D1B9E7C|nr:EamA family transporter [Thalassobius sp. I31.1]
MQQGWLISFGAVLFWALLSAVTRVVLVRFDLDPWGFSFVQLTTGGLVLLLFSVKAPFAKTSFLRPSTWIIGVFRVLSASLYTALLAIVSVLEAGIMGAISMSVVAISVWLVFARPPARGEWIGHLVVLACAAALVAKVDPSIRTITLTLVFANTICVVGMTVLAELHPDNLSEDPAVRIRFSGTVLLVTAGMFFLARLAQTGLSAEFWDWHMLLFGTLVGIFLRAPSMVLAFSSIRLVGSQNYSAATAFLPLFGMLMEHLFYLLGWINVTRFQLDFLYLGIGTAIGAITVIAARILARRGHAPSLETK